MLDAVGYNAGACVDVMKAFAPSEKATTRLTSVEPFDWLIFAKTSIGFSLIAGIITLSMVIRFFFAVNVSGL